MALSFSARTLACLAIICLLVPLAIYGTWLYASYQQDTHQESVSLFNNYLPSFLQAGYRTAILSAVLSMAAIYFSNKSLQTAISFWKVINYAILIVSGILLFLNIWQML